MKPVTTRVEAFEEGGDGLTAEQSQQLADGLNAIAEGYKPITAAQTANLELSRSCSAGWDEAFANYKTAAQNSAEQAKPYFRGGVVKPNTPPRSLFSSYLI